MDNYIISLNNELLEYYNEYKLNNDIKLFKKNVETLLYHYFNIGYITGINLTRKKLNLQLLNYYDEIDDLKFLNFKHNEINDIINKINNDYNFNWKTILKSLIYIYRYYQLQEFKNNGIQEIIFIVNNNSCDYCKILSKQKQNIDYLIKNLNKEHLYCYMKFHIINEINLSILNKIKFSNKDLLTNYNFILINNVDEIKELNKFYSLEEIDILKNNFISIQCDKNIYINNEYYNMNYLIIKYSIKDKLHPNDWWNNKFNNTNIFINYKSRKNSYQYLVENVVQYILNPNMLYEFDKENYDKIKNDIFNGIEIKGSD